MYSLLRPSVAFALVLGLATLALFLAWQFWVRRQFARRHGCQPVAQSFNRDPLLGLDGIITVLRDLHQHKYLERGCELFRRHGNTIIGTELLKRIIVTIEPQNIKTILSLKFNDYGIGHRLGSFEPLLGAGIFDTDGEHWASSRALIRPNFNRQQVADLVALEDLIQDLFALLPRDGKTIVDLQDLFFRYTIDSATDFLFGQSVGSLKMAESELSFADAFNYAQSAIVTRGTLGPLSMLYRDPKADRCNRICRDFAQRFVDEAVHAVETGKAEEERGQSETKRQNYIFSHELAGRVSDKRRILDELMNVLLAGRDTTASLLSNLFFMLAKNPAIWDKLRREVAVLDGLVPTYEELRGLKYVQCCINECEKNPEPALFLLSLTLIALRLHPVVPRNERQAVRDTVLPVGGGKTGLSPVFVPKGAIVCYNIYAMHRRKDLYGPDAEEFRPERWEDGRLKPRWEYLPFNGGPRICIGQRYALTEVSYVVVRMAQEFRLLKSRDLGPWEESLTLTLCSRNGTKVSLTPT